MTQVGGAKIIGGACCGAASYTSSAPSGLEMMYQFKIT
jgi:hypothetical protein